MTMEDWKKKLDDFLVFYHRPPQPHRGDPVSAYQARLHAETEFEKYKIVQDRLFMSDYDRFLQALEEEAKRMQDGDTTKEGER